MEMNTGILRSVVEDKYGFEFKDLIVASMIKAYLQQDEGRKSAGSFVPDNQPEDETSRQFNQGSEVTNRTVERMIKKALALLIDEASGGSNLGIGMAGTGR